MDDIPTVEWRDGELIIPAIRQEIERPWGEVETEVEIDKEKLDKIVRLIKYHEIKEATTLFELALWKAGIDQANISNSTNRNAHRIEVPGSVKDAILQYLHDQTVVLPPYGSAWSTCIGIYRSDLHYSKQIVYPKNRQWQELKAAFEGIIRYYYYEMKEHTILFELTHFGKQRQIKQMMQ